MKKRFYALMLVVAMLAMTLVGCGSDTTDTTNTTNDVTVNTEIEESGEVVEPEVEVDVPETEVPEVETTEEPTTEEDDFYADSYQWAFPESIGVEGFTDKYVLASDETMSFNCTHYVAKNGSEMNFSWVGPTELGEQADAGKTTLFLYGDNENYELRAWSSTLDSMDGAIKTYDKEIIVSVSDDTTYTEGDYYILYDEETYDKVIFKVTRNIDGVNYTGYAIYMDDYESMTTYQFSYVESNDVYNDERALKVANSIDFWTYNPGEIVTE